jgi:hypothetical protein
MVEGASLFHPIGYFTQQHKKAPTVGYGEERAALMFVAITFCPPLL